MAVEIRTLGAGDEALLLRFLEQHPETTMFLRGNLRRAGIVDRGQRFGGVYAAALDDGVAVAAAAHYWNGNIVVQAPTALAEVVRTAVTTSGRDVKGALGPWSQVERALAALRLDPERAQHSACERLFALELARLCVPDLLADPGVRCRPPQPEELDRLVGWSAAYHIETLGDHDSATLRSEVRANLQEYTRADLHWVLERNGEMVAYSAFNAALPDCVQVGGVFTPPPLRGRGYGRAVVAGTLLEARANGVSRSVLFTGPDNIPAQTAYRALGYEDVGDYGLVLFE